MKQFIFCTILAITMFLTGLYFGKKNIEPDIKEVTVTDTIKGDSIPYKVEIEKPIPKYIYRDTGKVDTFLKSVDTSEILSNYFSNIIYSDTLKNDSSAFISLSDTIYKNRIIGRKLYFQNNRTTKIETNQTIVNYKRDGVYLGGGIGLGVYEGDIMYLDNKDMYGVGVEALRIDNNIKYFFKVKYKRHIWKKQ